MANTMANLEKCNNFWNSLENAYDLKIPNYVKNLLNMMGYGNPIAFQRITLKKLTEIEEFVRDVPKFPMPYLSKYEDYFGQFYTDRLKFTFTPGDKDLILGLVERVKSYSDVFKKLLDY